MTRVDTSDDDDLHSNPDIKLTIKWRNRPIGPSDYYDIRANSISGGGKGFFFFAPPPGGINGKNRFSSYVMWSNAQSNSDWTMFSMFVVAQNLLGGIYKTSPTPGRPWGNPPPRRHIWSQRHHVHFKSRDDIQL